MATEPKPDLIVGIDLGQTCTGVAYNNLNYGSELIRWIQKWPGRAQSNENKVPTILVYPHGHNQPSSWGFQAELQSEHSPEHGTVREWFKTLLDPHNLLKENDRNPSAPIKHDDVRSWFRDYLSRVHDNIKSKLEPELPKFSWQMGRIEFLFSVPTTWNPPLVEDFRTLVGQAGFGSLPNHTVTIGLTEAEAAAVYTSTAAAGIFREEDVLIVCDAGGGTTDLSALKVTNTAVGALTLKQLHQLAVVTGENIGSAAIDYEFELLGRRRLTEAKELAGLSLDPSETAWRMAKSSEFQDTKCDHGAADNASTFSIPVPGLGTEFYHEELQIINGQMLFQKEVLRNLFDHQINKMFGLIDKQINGLLIQAPGEVIAHLVLSGGLGQSSYVQQKLRERYGEGSFTYPNASTMQVHVAPDPQLAVCKGLVQDRLRKLKAGKGVLGWRCCRASYGLICKQLYDKTNPKHFNRDPIKDTMDNKWYLTDMVDWFVVKGNPVSVDQPKSQRFWRRISPGDPRRVFPSKIVVSYRDQEELPHYMTAGVERLCDIESDLSGVEEKRFKEKNKKFWQSGPSYYEVIYDIKVVIGPADLRFELWFNGKKYSKDQSIKIEWAPTTAPSTAVVEPPPAPLLQEDGVLRETKPKSQWAEHFGEIRRVMSPPQGPASPNPDSGRGPKKDDIWRY